MERLSRFSALVEPLGGTVGIELSFYVDDENRFRVRGTVATRVGIECGRCLLSRPRDLNVALDLVLVGSDAEAAAVTGAGEPFVLEGEEIAVVDLIEDDLILALPTEACDEPASCPNRPPLDYPVAGETDAEEPRSPFAALASLVGKQN